MRKFSPLAVYKRFEKQWVPLKVEDDMRVFPQSNKSTDVISVFEKMFNDSQLVNSQLGNGVKDIQKKADWFLISTDSGEFIVDKVLIATWWAAYWSTWSTGDAYSRAKKLWHNVTKLSPSLSSFVIEESWVKSIPWTVFPSAQISVNGSKFSGPLLFTHWWISGPLAFELSAFLAHEHFWVDHPFSVLLQFDVAYDYAFWNDYLLASAKAEPHKSIKNILSVYFTKKFSETFLMKFFPQFANSNILKLRKDDRKKMCHYLSGKLEINLIWRKPGDEFVTAGGVATTEIDTKTMESKICPNLYFAGEVVDVDGVTGWFNLQACWAMGRVAGEWIMNNE